MSIEIANESGHEVNADAIVAVARHALGQMGVNPLAELSVLLVDSDYMAELNHRWMGKDGPTDVLAFPMDEDSIDHGPAEATGGQPALLGDIVLCPEVATQQAARYGTADPRMRMQADGDGDADAGHGSATEDGYGESSAAATHGDYETLATAGKNGDYSSADELNMLTIHGVLHLLGYDHAEPEEEREMFALQGKLLESWQAKQP